MYILNRRFIILLSGLLLFLSSAFAGSNFYGYVVKVTDGDSIVVVKTDQQRVKIRLVDIDAPEIRQAYGQKSKNSLAKLVAHQNVYIESPGNDIYGRVLGMVFVNGKNANEEQIRWGNAWAYQFKGQVNNPYFKELEQDAKRARMGLWKGKNPIAPWDWRRAHRK